MGAEVRTVDAWQVRALDYRWNHEIRKADRSCKADTEVSNAHRAHRLARDRRKALG